uniref:ATP-dependent DNA helicase n=1 Tax=Cannabis sativa TaxID=3483 RepID=A0A803PIG5_CANSA
MSGQNYHHIGSLLPEDGKRPQFAQFYIYDTKNEIDNRMNTLLNPEKKTEIDNEIVVELSKMLDQHNTLVKSFRMVRDKYKEQPEATLRLRLLQNRASDGRQYNMPTISEVVGLIVGDFSEANYERDVIVEHRTNGLQRITDLHPSFMSMTYPLIHPYGEDGYRLRIPFRGVKEITPETKQLTMLQYYSFRFQQRLNEGYTLLRAGRLLQQYIVDSYMAIEEEKFRYVRKHQNKLRTHLYSGLMDAIHRGDSDCTKVGKSIILPSSHTGGPRYRAQNYQDAMVICKWAGYPDLFLTFTCNPKWPELQDMLNLIGQKDDENRVDIICRVFYIKLYQLMQDLKREQPFGKIIAWSDKTTATVQSIDNTEGIDEIKTYLDCIYISATEACWRIFQFDIHYRKPSVERLPFHLPGEHTVIFGEDKCPENVLGTPGVDKTKFTEWLETNKNNEDARELTYSDFPTCWVWNSKDKIWTRRKQGIAIGRIYFAHPSTGERFYMRMMLNFVKGCTSYESIRTVNGVTYSTFKGACYALGLLDDDKEWIDCLTEAALWATGNELRHLFVTILINCQVSDVTKLWKSNYTTLSEDITALQRKRFKMEDLQLNDQQVEAYTLFEIECNRLVNEELDYDTKQLKILHDKSFALLNPSQKIAYEAILNSVENEEGKLFFISGHGGIAALLLPNGRTAHSRFHIPLEVTAESTCEIRHGTLLAELLMQTSLIIWDEAPMANKYCFEALDKTLRDILRTRYENSTTKPFGGLTIICYEIF